MLTDINAPTCNHVRENSDRGADGCGLSGNRATGIFTDDRTPHLPRCVHATRTPRTGPVPTTPFPRVRRQASYAGRRWLKR